MVTKEHPGPLDTIILMTINYYHR